MPLAKVIGFLFSATICKSNRGPPGLPSFNCLQSTHVLVKISIGPTAPIEFSVCKRGIAIVFINGKKAKGTPSRSKLQSLFGDWPIQPSICPSRPCLVDSGPVKSWRNQHHPIRLREKYFPGRAVARSNQIYEPAPQTDSGHRRYRQTRRCCSETPEEGPMGNPGVDAKPAGSRGSGIGQGRGKGHPRRYG